MRRKKYYFRNSMLECLGVPDETIVSPETGALDDGLEVREFYLHLVRNSLRRAQIAGQLQESPYTPLGRAYFAHPDGREVEVRGHKLLPEIRVGYPLKPNVLRQAYGKNRAAEWKLRNPYELLYSFRPMSMAPFLIERNVTCYDARAEEKWLGGNDAAHEELAQVQPLLFTEAEPISMLPSAWQMLKLHAGNGG